MTKDLLVCLSSECVGFTLRLVGGQWCGELPGHWHVMDKDLNACLLKALQKAQETRGVWVDTSSWNAIYFVDGLKKGVIELDIHDERWDAFPLTLEEVTDNFVTKRRAKAWVEAQVHGE